MSIGEFIIAARERKGISVRDAAYACGVTTQAFYRWQNGSVPSSSMMHTLASVLGLDEAGVAEMVRLAGEQQAA